MFWVFVVIFFPAGYSIGSTPDFANARICFAWTAMNSSNCSGVPPSGEPG
jgi:hypothetical protein